MKGWGQTMGVFSTNDSSKVAQTLIKLGFNVDAVEGRNIYIAPTEVGPSIEKLLQLSELDGYGLFGVSAKGEPATSPTWMVEIDKDTYARSGFRGYMFGVSAIRTDFSNLMNSRDCWKYIEVKQKVCG